MKIAVFGMMLLVFKFACCDACEDEEKKEFWLQHFLAAETSMSEKDFPKAVEHYSASIDIMQGNNENVLFAVNARGLASLKKGDYSSAVSDFSKVISFYAQNPISVNLSQAVNALWNRFAVYSRTGQAELAALDYNELVKLDPNFPIFEHVGNSLIIKNLYAVNNSEVKEKFSSIMTELGVCANKDSIQFFKAGIAVIKTTEAFSSLMNKNNSLHKNCKAKGPVDAQTLITCQKRCDDIAYSLALGCASCITAAGKASCAAVLYVLKNTCHWCCSGNNFYKKCLKPLEIFNPRDPAWDDEIQLPDRDLNDKDLIWNDRDLVYKWEDI